MTTTDRRNNEILESHRAEIEARCLENWQAGIDYANSLIDVTAGIVAADGGYCPRRDRDGNDPFGL